MFEALSSLGLNGGTSGAGTGGSSARSDHSGWIVAAPGSVNSSGGSFVMWLAVGAAVGYLIGRGRRKK